MSGIFGICNLKKEIDSEHIVPDLFQISSQRGADAQWQVQCVYRQSRLLLGESVLKSMPDAEFQCSPMQSADGKYILLYDGEVYNYEELKRELAPEYLCKTDSDAEVVLYSLIKWGMKALSKFNGLFSIAFADLNSGKLYLVRDRGGMRPLYIYFNGTDLVFASRLQAIQKYPCFKPEIDESVLVSYLQNSFVPEPFCIFRDCMKPRPGHYAELDLNTGKLTHHQYWDLIEYLTMPKLDISYAEAQKRIEELFLSSCQYRCAGSSLPGCLLSGGYDSSGVAAFLSHIHPGIDTYTIGFDAGVNEAPDAERIAQYLKTSHHQKYCHAEEARNIIEQLPDIYDEPFGDSSAIPTTLAARLAAQSSRVVFSADSGDETFAGYDRYQKRLSILQMTGKIPSLLAPLLAKFFDTAALFPFPYNKRHALEFESRCLTEKIPPDSPVFLRSELNKLLVHSTAVSLDFLEKRMFNLAGMLFWDFHVGLAGDSFVKVDRAMAAAGMQYREPVMDHRITEFAAQLPDSFKMNMEGGKKIIYKDLIHKYIPKKLMDRPKHGFSIPIAQWIKEDLNSVFKETFSSKNTADIPFFKQSGIKQLFQRYEADPENNFLQRQLWHTFCFVNWYNHRVR